MAKQLYWIKERNNPQLGTYYIPCGQMSKSEAKKHDSSLYGSNQMFFFATEEEYLAEIQALKAAGNRVH